MKKVRWGIVGPGKIANKFATAMKNIECAEIRAVASRSLEKGNEFAVKYGIPKVYCGYENLAASDEIDAVYIATPHSFHKSCAEIFMKAGKHVLCEKPLCINETQAVALQTCAKQNGVFLMEAMWTGFLPAIKEACKIAESGVIGEVMGLSADFCYAAEYKEGSRIFESSLAGGALLDVGVYGLHLAALFLGYEPEKIHANAWIEKGIDRHTKVVLQYANGAIAEVSSAVSLRKPESAYIYGTKGRIYLPHFYGAEELYVTAEGKEEHLLRPPVGAGFEEEILEACHCILNGKTESDMLSLTKSIAIVRQMDEIRRQIGLKYPLEGEE